MEKKNFGRKKFNIFFLLGWLSPPKPLSSWGSTTGTFGLNQPSQLVIGYHWLPFLNQVRIRFRTLRIFWNQKHNLVEVGGKSLEKGVYISLTRSGPSTCKNYIPGAYNTKPLFNTKPLTQYTDKKLSDKVATKKPI